MITSRHVLSAAHCFKLKYDFVRLGEHNTTVRTDEYRVDIDIDRVEIHEQYISVPKLNDIAVVYLVRDVEFTGKLESSKIHYDWQFTAIDIYFIHCIDRIRPICLPTSEEVKGRSFIGNMPFVGNYTYN